MKDKLRSLFKRKPAPAAPATAPAAPATASAQQATASAQQATASAQQATASAQQATASAQQATASAQQASEPGSGSSESVLDDLICCVCECSPDSFSPSEVDASLHMYDAGYVNSITGAELLVHIEKRYGLFIAETELVGRLCSLDELARHIAASTS